MCLGGVVLLCPKEELRLSLLGSLICLLLAPSGVSSWHTLPESPQVGCEQSEEWSFHCWSGAEYPCEKVSGDFCSKNSAVLLRQQLKGQLHIGRTISVVKDVFMSCALVSRKVSSAVGKQHRQRQAKRVPSFLFAERTMEREAFVMGAGHGCLEERHFGMQPLLAASKLHLPLFAWN